MMAKWEFVAVICVCEAYKQQGSLLVCALFAKGILYAHN